MGLWHVISVRQHYTEGIVPLLVVLQIGTSSHRFDHPRLNTPKLVFAVKITLAVGTA